MFDALAKALAFFYDLWPSYGGAILLLTLGLMLVLTPLSIKSTRSMIKMQRVQPELKRLQAQYKGDREALNKEMMAFYQANNINPFSSCLPMLLQMPVFIVLYRVLHGLTRTGRDGKFDPKYLNHDSALYQALHRSTKMMSWGIDLSRSALRELQDGGLIKALPFFVMIALVAATAWYQQRQIAGRNPNAAANPQQQMIGKIMPFIFVPITISIPAGVVIYFVVSNVVRVAQQALVTKLEFGEGGSGTEIVKPDPITPPPKRPGNSAKAASGRTTPSSSAAARNRNNKKRKRN
ncbi:MAG: YidC/Oxa1 family rane protein insertase [Acidimicrobiaceae bacterium]|jgi:YidC/Oxa1 family membrane protein insertase|nr:YidC/Oxa1 family rane protein insertase [Acidimicrobiaceae bacterium]